MALYHAYSEVENSNTGVPMSGVRVVPVFPNTGGGGAGVAAPIYKDESSTPFVPENYCITDETGMYSFYIDPGSYNLDFFIGSKFIRRIEDVQFIDPIPTSVEEPYRATLSEAINEFPIGFYFRSDDKNAEGPYPNEMWIYQRIGLEPYYVALASNTASLAEINAGIAAAAAEADRSEAAAQNALNYGNAALRSDYVAADAETWTVGAWVQVLSSDTGTHTPKAGDYNPGGGNTPNAGVYQEDASLGLVRKADLEGQISYNWAEGTLPGGAGTKSAKEWAADAATQANYEQTVGRPLATTPVTGSALGTNVYVFAAPLTQAGQLYMLRFYAQNTGTLTISTWSKAGDIFTRQSATAVAINATGLNEIPLASLPVLNAAAGLYVGVSGFNTIAVTNAAPSDSGGLYIGTYGTSFTDATVDTTPRIEIGLSFGAISSQRFLGQRLLGIDSRLNNVSPTGSAILGKVGIPITGSANPNRTFAIGTPAVAAGLLRSLRFWALTSGTIKVRKFIKTGDIFTQTGDDLSLNFIAASPGIVTITVTDPFHIAAGQYVGFYATSGALVNAGDSEQAGIGYYDNQAAGGGDASTFTDTAISYAVTLQIGFTFDAIQSNSLLDNMLGWIEEAGNSGSVDPNFPGVTPTGYVLVWGLGQSNVDGRAPTFSQYTFEAGQAYKYVRASTSLALMADPTSNTGNNLGSMGPALAKEVQRLSNGKMGVIFINSARGGTPLLPRAGNLDWSPTGSLRGQAEADLANTLTAAAALNLPIVGCCAYLQLGETDGDNGVSEAAWIAEWDNFQAWMTSKLGSKAPMLMTRIGVTNPNTTPANYQAIRNAQDTIAQTRAGVLMVHSGTRQFLARGLMIDAFHYNIQGYNEIGQAAGAETFVHAANQRPLGYTW